MASIQQVVGRANTTGNLKFAECFYVCRVHLLGRSANKFFAEFYHKNTAKNTQQRERFAECQTKNTRQIGGLPSVKKTLGKAKK